jgi:multiple sugar transport system substrate-binding protein
MRKMQFAVLVSCLALVAAACGSRDEQGGQSGAPGSQAPASSGPVAGNVDVWAMGNEGTLLGTLAKDFETANSGVTAKVTPVDWGQAVSKLQTAIGGGGATVPDVSQMGTDMMGQFAATEGLEPVPANFQASSFFESAWNTATVDDTVYGVPWYVETRVLYYRKDIAEEAGITEAPTNWDELKAMAKAMKEKGGAQWGIGLGPKNNQEFLPFLWSNGGDIMDDSGAFTLDSPEAIEALTFYDSFFEEGLAPKSVPEGFDITPAFASGTHPMFFSGPWHLGLIDKAGAGDQIGLAVIPGPDGPGTSWIGGSNVVVFADSDNKSTAWKFVEFLTDPATQVKWYEQAAVMPSTTAGWEDPKIADDEQFDVFAQQMENTRPVPAIPTWNEVSSAINDELERVTTGNATPEAGAKAMQEKATSIGVD